MTTNEIEQQVREFLMSNFIFDSSVQLGDDDFFMENGVVELDGRFGSNNVGRVHLWRACR